MPDLVFSVEFMLFLFFILPFAVTITIMPHIIKKFYEKGLVTKDMYKYNYPPIPTNGGLIILLIALLFLSFLSLFYNKYITPINYVIILVIVLFSLFGLLDDYINIGRPAKLLLLYYCALSIIPFIETTYVLIPFIGAIDFSLLYIQIIGPLYIPVTSNLVNMHSGFNGLAPGVSLIILVTLIVKSYFFGNIFNILFIVCLTGSMAGYYLFEKYPSKIFWGNIGALSVGAAIGAVIITQGFIVSGIIMLFPHIVNFILYLYWRLNTDKYPLIKFGSLLEDGTLSVPNPFTLKWVFPYYFKLGERTTTKYLFGLTAVFCFIGLYIPG